MYTHLIAQSSDKSTANKDSLTSLTNTVVDLNAFTIMKTGSIVPDFELTTIGGKTFQLSKQKGKTIFLNFFTLVCPNCMKELPVLEKEIWQKYKNNPNVVILIIGREEPVNKLKKFKSKKRFTFPIAPDPERKVYSLFASQYVPRNIVIDKEGKLVLTEVGFSEEKSSTLIQSIKNELDK